MSLPRNDRVEVLSRHPSDVVAVADVDRRVTYVSPSVERMLGYSPARYASFGPVELVHPEDVGIAEIASSQVRAYPSAEARCEVRLRQADGNWRWVEVIATNLLDDPEVEGVLSVIRDVNDRHVAEAARRESEARFRALVQHSTDGIVVVGADSAVSYASPGVAAMLGYDPDDTVGLVGLEFCHPDDSVRANAAMRTALVSPGVPIRAEGRVRHADGSYRWIEVVLTNLLDEPSVGGLVANIRDITDRRAAEVELRLSEERFRALVHSSADLLVIADSDRKLTYVSPSVEDMLGWTPTEFGANYWRLLHPEDTARAREFSEFVRTHPGQHHVGEWRERHKDGTWRWMQVTAVNLLSDPNIRGVITNFRDSTDGKVAEQALRASEERFRSLVLHSSDAIGVLGRSLEYTWVSESVRTVLGYDVNDLIGQPASAFAHPDEAAGFETFTASLIDHPGEPMHVVGRARHADGTYRWLDIVATNRIDDPAVDGIVVNFRDITEERAAAEQLRASEARFRALVHSSSDVIAVLGDDALVTWISPTVRGMLGHDPAALVGRVGLDLIHPDDQEETAWHLAMLLEGKPTGRPLTVRIQREDGTWPWIDITASNLLVDPEVGGLVVNLRDVTAQVEARDALQASEERFRTLVQHASDVVQISDENGLITYISPAVESVLGYTPEEMLGRSALELCHPEDVAEAMRLAAGLRAAAGSVHVEARVRHANGEWRWVDALVSNHIKEPGVRGVVSNFRDITERKAAEQAMLASEARFRLLSASSPIGIYEQDPNGTLLFVNERWREITGSEAERGWGAIVHPDDLEHTRAVWGETGLHGKPFSTTLRVVRADRETRWVAVSTAPLFDGDGALVGHVGTMDDITDRLSAQRDADRLTDIVGATSDLVAITDKYGRLLFMNEASRQFFGLAAGDGGLDGFDFTPFTPPWAQQRYLHEAVPTLREHDIWSGELAYFRRGIEVPVSALFLAHRDGEGHLEFVSSVTRDISERKAFEARLEHQATHDPLTGLPNRTLLLDRLEMAVARASRHEHLVAVLFLDLDHFKVVNDSLGHGLGDRLLVALADRLKQVLRPGDTVARFGGDEFVILCEELADAASAIAVADRIQEAVAEPFAIDDSEVFVTVSTGIAFASPARDDPEALIRDTDAAMYQAKERGRARSAVFDERMRAGVVDRLEMESALRRALERHELQVFYQPKIDLRSGRIVGVEALLRWAHPERGLLLPYEFVELAEETGLIVQIGAWVLEQSCRQAIRWQTAGPHMASLFVGVNLSGRQLDDPSLPDDVAAVLARTGVDPASIILEITESVVMRDALASQATLAALKGLGVKLAIDDFGTGYSSLAYLRRFPVDLLKVDRAFVAGLARDPEDSAIVAAVVTLAHTLGMQAIAEGVETAEQLQELRSLGCDMAQGYFVTRPLPADDVQDLLMRDPRW